jgi:predicted signal transduction protein with EAL and GGDEF domain
VNDGSPIPPAQRVPSAGEAARAHAIPRDALRNFLDAAIEHARADRARLAVMIVSLLRSDRLDALFGLSQAALAGIAEARLADVLKASDRYLRVSDTKLCVVLPGLRSDAQAVLAAAKIARCLEAPYALEGRQATLRPVIGIACFPDHASTAEQMVVNADIALRVARARDLSSYMFQREDRVEVHAYLGLETALREAIETNQLGIHYQPQIDLRSGHCVGVEALLRWTAADRGPIAPAIAIRIAEQNGLIGGLTAWIANTVVRHQSEWRRRGLELCASINLSTVNLVDHDFPAQLAQMLGTWGADPGLITLEITESSTIDDADRSLAVLRRLKALGVKLAVDDFGTGYSSLSYVKRFPLDELKIDKLFVQHMRGSRGDQAIVRSVIDLAHNFDLKVVAEGVEDAATLAELRAMGCDLAQGFHISQALPSNALLHWLETGAAAP